MTLFEICFMSAQALFAQAKENYDLGILSLTEEVLQNLITQYPDYAPAHHLLAKVAYDDNQGYDAMIAHYDNAINADPSNMAYKHEKTCREVNFLLHNGGEQSEMKAMLAPVLQQNPNHAEGNYLMGRIIDNNWEISADKNELLTYYDKAIANDHTHQEWFMIRSQVHSALDFENIYPRKTTKHLENEIADLKSIIDLNPTNDWASGAYHYLAGVYVQLERFEDAIAELETLRIFPGDNARYMDTAIMLMAEIKAQSMQDYQGALTNYDELVEYVEASEDTTLITNSTKASAYYNRGKLKIEHLNQKNEGLADLKKAHDYLPDDEFYKGEYETSK